MSLIRNQNTIILVTYVYDPLYVSDGSERAVERIDADDTGSILLDLPQEVVSVVVVDGEELGPSGGPDAEGERCVRIFVDVDWFIRVGQENLQQVDVGLCARVHHQGLLTFQPLGCHVLKLGHDGIRTAGVGARPGRNKTKRVRPNVTKG